jgi:hypothetical protein
LQPIDQRTRFIRRSPAHATSGLATALSCGACSSVLVGGEDFAIDANLIEADANKHRSIPGARCVKNIDPEQARRAASEQLAKLPISAHKHFDAVDELVTVLLRKAPLQGLNRLRGFTNQTIESRSARSSKKRCAICVPKVIWNSKRNSRLRRSGAKSPADFIEATAKHARHQFEVLTQQTKEHPALAQN